MTQEHNELHPLYLATECGLWRLEFGLECQPSDLAGSQSSPEEQVSSDRRLDVHPIGQAAVRGFEKELQSVIEE